MANNQLLTATIAPIDPVTVYGFPATADVFLLSGGTTGGRMLIWYAGAPAALFNNAPLGSVCFDTTNGDAYIMTAAETWTKASP